MTRALPRPLIIQQVSGEAVIKVDPLVLPLSMASQADWEDDEVYTLNTGSGAYPVSSLGNFDLTYA
jgi:hypothetical protein